MLYYDLKKTLLNKKSVLLISILLLFQVLLFFVWSNSSDVVAKDYKEIQAHIQTMELTDANQYINEELDKLNKQFEDMETPVLLNNESTFDRGSLLRLQQEMKHLLNYQDFYQSIIHPEETNSGISIFQNNDGFIKERQERIRNHYPDKDLSAGTSSTGSYGMEQVLMYSYVDLFVILILIYLCYIQIDKDQDQGSTCFFLTMKNGSVKNYISKFISILLPTVFFVIMSYILMILINGSRYGFVDYTAPIQSILYCGRVFLETQILPFLVIFLGIRCMFLIFVALLLYAFIFILKRVIFGVSLFCALLLFGNLLSSLTNDANSILSFFSTLNILHPEKLFIAVTYFSAFQHAVYFPYLYLGIGSCTIVFFYLGYHSYQKGKSKPFALSAYFHDKHFHTLPFYEIKKSWINGLGILAMVVFLCFSISFFTNIKTLSYQNDRIISYYIDHLGKSPTKETYDNIAVEENRFSLIHEQIALTNNPLEKKTLSEQLNGEISFSEYCNRINRLQNDTNREVLKVSV